MYAFSVLLNELLTEQVPFPDSSFVQIVQTVGTFRKRPVEFRAEAGDEVGQELMTVIARCWHQDPTLRMSFHELSGELTHLLRKAAENARRGDQASPLTPPRPPTQGVEAAITELTGWLTASCHVEESDAMSLAHVLVTVKRVTSPAVLSQVLQRSPDFISKELKQSVVTESQICAALSISSTSTISASSVNFASLDCDQLCALLTHCNMSEFHAFAVQNKLKGTHFPPTCAFQYIIFDLLST